MLQGSHEAPRHVGIFINDPESGQSIDLNKPGERLLQGSLLYRRRMSVTEARQMCCEAAPPASHPLVSTHLHV